MHTILKILSLALILVLGMGTSTANSAPPIGGWQSKVDRSVYATAADGETEFILYLAVQADLSGAGHIRKKEDKGKFVYQRLTETAGRTQKPIVAELSRLGVEFRPFWIANMIWVRGDLNTLMRMAQRFDIDHVFANPKVYSEKPISQPLRISPQAVLSNE